MSKVRMADKSGGMGFPGPGIGLVRNVKSGGERED